MPAILAWHYANTLDDLHLADPSEGGVYLFVFDGPPRRVVYVGTTGLFADRLKHHVADFAVGLRTMWRPGNEDVYSLMKGREQEDYVTLARAGHVWVPNDQTPGRDVFGVQEWEGWKESVPAYLDRLHVWTCVMDSETALDLESVLQGKLGEAFSLGYYRGGQTWLGKPHRPDASRMGWTCPRWPIVDAQTEVLLRSLETGGASPITGGDRGR